MPSSYLVLCSLMYILLQPATASISSSSKPARPLVAATWVRARDVKKSLSDVLDDTLSHEHRKASEVRVDRLTDALRPIYAALPKNKFGLLGHSTVRYALHRHFVHKHGMYVKGLEPAGEAWNSSSPTDILEDKVPSYVQHLFEERLHDGFDLKELALLAATLEHFVHLEAIERLKAAYRLSGFAIDQGLSSEQLETVLDKNAFLQLDGGDYNTMEREVFDKQFLAVAEIFPEWPETQSFLREVQESTLDSEEGSEKGPHGGLISFAHATNVIEAAGRRYGRFQDGGCRSLAKELIAGEEHGSGRIKLSDFYQLGWQFRESKEYLRTLGALDETTAIPRVVIPNYVAAASNCVASSTMYSVCCIDQCEELLGHLERRILGPDSTPEHIVELIAALPSATVQAPRHLSVSVVKRLNEISESHGGRVPLHGRLFSQWMHHAYPRECPFPMASGTTKPMTADDWMKETNSTMVVSDQEIQSLVQQTNTLADQAKVKDLADGDLESTLPWFSEEELVFHHTRPSLSHEFGVLGKALAFVGALFSMTLKLLQMTTGATSKARGCAAMV